MRRALLATGLGLCRPSPRTAATGIGTEPLRQSRDGGRSSASETAWGNDFDTDLFSVSPQGWGLRLVHTPNWQNRGRQSPQLWARDGPQSSWSQRTLPGLPTLKFAEFQIHESKLGAAGAWLIVRTQNSIGPTVWRSEDKLQTWSQVTTPAAPDAEQQPGKPIAGDHASRALALGLLDDRSMWIQTFSEKSQGCSLRFTTDGGRTGSNKRHPNTGDSDRIGSVWRDSRGALLLTQAGSGSLFRSTNDGRHNDGRQWLALLLALALPAVVDEFIDRIWMLDRDQGLAISNWGRLLHTRDGGQTWAARTKPCWCHVAAGTEARAVEAACQGADFGRCASALPASSKLTFSHCPTLRCWVFLAARCQANRPCKNQFTSSGWAGKRPRQTHTKELS